MLPTGSICQPGDGCHYLGVTQLLNALARLQVARPRAARTPLPRGGRTLTLRENQSTYIPVGMKHRLANPGKAPVYLVEVQSGGYLGEDDIERFEDRYGLS